MAAFGKGWLASPKVMKACGKGKRGVAKWKKKGFKNFATCAAKAYGGGTAAKIKAKQAKAKAAGLKIVAAKPTGACPPGTIQETWGCVKREEGVLPTLRWLNEDKSSAAASHAAAAERSRDNDLIDMGMGRFGKHRRKRRSHLGRRFYRR
jgi:hypothetical protein